MNKSTLTNIQPTKATVYIAGKKLVFFSLRLEQSFGEHHHFSIETDFASLEQSFMNVQFDVLKLLWQPVDIDFQQGDDNADTYRFRGIIQNIAVGRQEEKQEYLTLSGASPTILMEEGRCYDMFTDLTLKQVVERLTKDVIIGMDECFPIINNPECMEQMEFLMQYGENGWQFLRRLSYIAKENLYWTGSDLVFGRHKDFPILEATYGREIPNVQSGSRCLSGREDKHIKTDSDSQTTYFKGTSRTAHPRIGRLLKIKMPNMTNKVTEPETLRITKVIHEYTRDGHYECQFEGIPVNLKHYPFMDVNIPVTEPISVQVISNADPEGQGRVRVKFPFNTGSVSDAWLRVMVPTIRFAGDEKKNKPTDFIPEPGDQVMVNFTYGDPNLPFVIANTSCRKNEKEGIENAPAGTSVSQEDYEDILKFRDKLHDRLESIAAAIEIIKKDYNIEQQRMFLKTILEFLLLVAQTEKGRKLFFDTLEYVKTIDSDLSNEIWKIYDEEIETILRNGYVKVNRNN